MLDDQPSPPRESDRRKAGAHPQLLLLARRIALLAAIVAASLGLGAIGLALAEGVGAWYAFRWALDTAATVGGFPQPHTLAGQLIHVLLIVLGVGTLFYGLATLTELIVGGHLAQELAARRTRRMINSLTDHHIICSFGRVGRQVARDLRAARAEYLVVDPLPENEELAQDAGAPFIKGDPANDAVLIAAGIDRARSIIACADSDPQNIFITLTARELRADIPILARAAVEDSEKKLKRAGADRVISPYKASGTEMARLALHPQLRGVVDVDAEYRLETLVVGAACEGAHQMIGDIGGGAMIVGLRRGSAFDPQPPSDTVLLPGDIINAIGTPSTLGRLESLFETHGQPTSGGRRDSDERETGASRQ
ncbi:MAG: potassium channel family protein [Solirubrobacteraceae bacterium]